MNWLNKLIANKPTVSSQSKDIPEDLWVKCPSCHTLLYSKDLRNNNEVCTNCSHHFFLNVEKRLNLILDAGYVNIKLPEVKEDPLKFKDTEKYVNRLKKYRTTTGHNDAIVCAYGTVEAAPVVLSVMNFKFMGGSMGSAVGEGFVAGVEHAIKKNCPFVAVTSSGGARMQEGVVSLMQMAKTSVALERLKDKGLPYIVILTNPTTGGITASFAMLGDIHIAEAGATIGFTGARVIEQTIRKKLPEGFQTAEYLLDHGMVDIVSSRHDLKGKLSTILNLLHNKS